MAPTRRTLIAAGLLGTAVLAVGGVGAGLALQGTVQRVPPRPLRVLSTTEFSILAAVAGRLVQGPGLAAVDPLQTATAVDDVLATMHPAAAGEVRQVLMLLENGLVGFLLGGRTATFTASDPATQDAVLRGWATASIPLLRTAYRALHGLCMGATWSRHDLYAAAGYPGPPPLQRLAPPEPAAEADPAEVAATAAEGAP